MGDPVGALSHARSALADDGTIMLVEPNAGDSAAENMHPLGRLFYSISTLVCTPASRAQEVGTGLGAQAGPGAACRHCSPARSHPLPPGRLSRRSWDLEVAVPL